MVKAVVGAVLAEYLAEISLAAVSILVRRWRDRIPNQRIRGEAKNLSRRFPAGFPRKSWPSDRPPYRL